MPLPCCLRCSPALCCHVQVGFPHTAVLGRLPGTNVFRNVKQYPEAQQYPGILTIRIDAPLYYANVPVSITEQTCFHASSPVTGR